MTDIPDDNAPARQPEPAASIATAKDFSLAMLNAGRELNQNEALRREVAKRIS